MDSFHGNEELIFFKVESLYVTHDLFSLLFLHVPLLPFVLLTFSVQLSLHGAMEISALQQAVTAACDEAGLEAQTSDVR